MQPRRGAYAGYGDYDRSIASADEAIKLKPDDEAAYADRGTYLLPQRRQRPGACRFEQGAGAAARILACAERTREPVHLNQIKDYDQRPIADYRRATISKLIAKNNAEAYNNRGIAYQNKGDNDRAIADYSEAIRLNPKFADAFANRAWAYLSKKDADSAIADFTRAIELNPKDAISSLAGPTPM